MPQNALTARDPAQDDVASRCDVLIVGGGLVGASLAIALDALDLDVVLLDATPAGQIPAVFDQRNLSFADATCNALDALGVMRLLRSPGGPIRRIHASRAGDFGRVVLDATRHGRDMFGRVVVARDFGEALEARLAQSPRLRRMRPATFMGFDTDGDTATHRAVRIGEGGAERVLHARLVVAADGTHSAVRAALAIPTDLHDYGHRLVVTRLRTAKTPDGTAYERLGDQGPTALLPRGDRHYGLVLGVETARADAVMALDDAQFLAHAQGAFGWRAGRFLACGPRSLYPALRVVAAATTAPRVVLIGNAAQALHPVGAQGFNLGLRDALTLAEVLADAGHERIGDADVLARHVQRRREDREQTLRFSDALARLGALPGEGVRPLRSLVLAAIGRVPSLEATLVGGAMGYRGDVPALCRGGA